MFRFKKIIQYERILYLLRFYDNYFTCPLSRRLNSLPDYARKLQMNAVCIEAQVDGSVAGIAFFYANNLITQKGYLTQIAVTQKYQGMGLAKKLLNIMEKIMLQNKMFEVELEVEKNNKTALCLYSNCGYRIIKSTDEAYFMRKELQRDVFLGKKRNDF